jgi:calcineurin-like phosphoesterase family protein
VVQLFGHVHTRWRGAEGQVNVGVDQWDFTPITPDQAELEALMLPPSNLRRMAEGAE